MSRIVRWWEDNYQSGGNIYSITESFRSRSRKFKTDQQVFNISFNTVNKTFDEAQNEIKNLFIDLHEQFLGMMGDKDYIRVTFLHDDFDRGIGYPFMSKRVFMNANLLHTFESVIQSYKTINMNNNNSLRAAVYIARLPNGGNLPESALQNHFDMSSNIIVVKNDDNYCMIHAVLIAIQWYNNKKFTYGIRNKLSRQVHSIALKLKIKNKKCGIKEAKLLEMYFRHYQITIIDMRQNTIQEPYFIGTPNAKHIYIAYTGSHYNVIKSMKVFTKKSYYCDLCKIGYNNLRSHKCIINCSYCQRQNCIVFNSEDENGKIENSYKKCEHCDLLCNNEKCHQIHIHSFCEKLNTCNTCGRLKYSKKIHVCKEQKYCRNCNASVELDHQCYILTEKEKKPKVDKINGYIFYDYETFQNDEMVHEANLIIAERLCIDCANNSMCKKVNFCKIYSFDNNMDFCKWLFTKENQHFTAVAHNFQGFDGVFVMKYIKETMLPSDPMPDTIVNGTKIMTLTFKKVRLIDSFLFIPMSLEKFPKTFGLNEMKKGFWCHRFNSKNNIGYIGQMPDKLFYSPEFFSDSKKLEFDRWYDDQKHKIFDFDKELYEYCLSDVKLLKHGVLSFRKNILQITKGEIDPFHRCITIASLCHLVYRSMLMKPKTIGIISPLGINPKRGSSNISLQWLKFLSGTRNIYIQHARNGEERKIGNYYVDGYSKDTKTIFEFMGCFW